MKPLASHYFAWISLLLVAANGVLFFRPDILLDRFEPEQCLWGVVAFAILDFLLTTTSTGAVFVRGTMKPPLSPPQSWVAGSTSYPDAEMSRCYDSRG